MTVDIDALDRLPETDPAGLADVRYLGLRPCYLFSCFFTYIGTTVTG